MTKKYVPTKPHTALRVRGTGSNEDTFVEEATVTFTKNVLKYRESTQSELVTSKLYKLEKIQTPKALATTPRSSQSTGTLDLLSSS